MQITQGNKLAQDSFFVTKIQFRIKLQVIMNGIVNGFPILNSDQVMQYTPLCHVTSTCLELTTNQNRTSQLLEIRKLCVECV